MKPSDVTVTDLFCGAGGSSIGAAAVGARLRLGLNHWPLAIETHNTNFPDADHDCTDVSQCDPRRYPSTNILIASPECTNHSLAKGKKRKGQGQPDLFIPQADDPAAVRSRATMWDVPRFAEFHDYEIVIVENVIDARHWVLWDAWLKAMECLDYLHRCVYLNSMFCHPTPQSRDRLYIVFWKRGNRAPDLEGLEAEAARSRRRELLRALNSVLPMLTAEEPDDLTDDDLKVRIGDEWDEVEYTFDDEATPPEKGAYLHMTEAGREAWCFLRGGDAPAFFYDVQLGEEFNPFEALPDLEGEALVVTARRLYASAPDDIADEEEAATPPGEPADTETEPSTDETEDEEQPELQPA